MTTNHAPWSGMVTVDDTALAVTDTGGTGTPIVYLNGSYADQKHWRRVISQLGADFRHITFDERARGKSDTATDYSFQACLRDVDAVLTARDVEQPILVGWSYGGLIAMHYAARNPDRVAAVVNVDGALPHTDWFNDTVREQTLNLFRRLGPLYPLLRPLGLAAKMSAVQHAEINLEMIELCDAGNLGPVLDRITTPTRYIVGTGGNLGADAKTMEQLRTNLAAMITTNPNIRIGTKVPSNHSKILRNNPQTIAETIRNLTTTTRTAPAAPVIR